jgi:hypothetical protein
MTAGKYKNNIQAPEAYSIMEAWVENIKKFSLQYDIHEVCLFCANLCKKRYSHWSGMMPPNIYCDDYVGG